jgi:hypothetical protein
MTTIEERKKNRWLMLQKFYELAKGHAGYDPINMWEVGEQLGWDRETTEATYDYLQGEGLLNATTLGGGATITHEGVKEVEKAEEHPQEPTLHFPAFIVNITGRSETVHGDRIEVRGDAVGAALGRGARAEARDINVYREAIAHSAFDAELKRVLVEAREALEREKLSVDDKNDTSDDLNKLAQELETGASTPRVQRLWKRIKEIAPTVASILAAVASISKLLHQDS